jgi:hypothetical protein
MKKVFLNAFALVLYAPKIIASTYMKYSRQHRRALVVIERYLHQMVEHELAESPELVAQRKRTCFIASLVASLKKDEKLEAMKSEDEKRGKIDSIEHFSII